MYNVVESAFNEAMKREGQILSFFVGSDTFKAFFRRNADNLSHRDTMIMYYEKAAPVRAGSLIMLNDEIYLALNKEHEEGTIYNKSALEKCNGTITTNNLSVCGLPFFGSELKSGLAVDGTHVSLIDGNMEILTEDCEASRALQIDDTFNEYGRTWKIENIFYVDGICHIVVQISVNEEIHYDYELELSKLGTMSAIPGDVLNLYATAYINGVEDETAEIKFKSSNDDVATITQDGNIVFIAPGEVVFTASWDAHNIIKYTNKVTCIEMETDEEGNIEDDTIALYVAETPELYCDFENDAIEYYVTRGGQKVHDIPVTFKAEYPASAAIERRIEIVVSDGSVLVNPDDSRLRGKSFTLIASNVEYGLEHKQTIKVVSAW